MEDFEQIKRDPISRRAFLMRMSAAGLGVAAAGLLQGCNGNGNNGGPGVPINGQPTATPNATATGTGNTITFPALPGTGDIKVLNFALTLERLEADLYRQSLNKAAGKPLDTPLAPIAQANTFYGATPTIGAGNFTGTGVDATTRANVGFTYLKQFTYIEAAHRDFLIAGIRSKGGTPVGPVPTGYRYPNNNPGDDMASIIANIVPLEENGTRAYLGGVPLISGLDVLTSAGTIYSTECRHAASFRYLLDENNVGPSTNSVPGTTDQQVAPSPAQFNGVTTELFEKFYDMATALRAGQRYIQR